VRRVAAAREGEAGDRESETERVRVRGRWRQGKEEWGG
jgi:hypothetical protein